MFKQVRESVNDYEDIRSFKHETFFFGGEELIRGTLRYNHCKNSCMLATLHHAIVHLHNVLYLTLHHITSCLTSHVLYLDLSIPISQFLQGVLKSCSSNESHNNTCCPGWAPFSKLQCFIAAVYLAAMMRLHHHSTSPPAMTYVHSLLSSPIYAVSCMKVYKGHTKYKLSPCSFSSLCLKRVYILISLGYDQKLL